MCEGLATTCAHRPSLVALTLPNVRLHGKDPLHDFFEALAKRLGADCEAELITFIELDRFLNRMSTFDRVVFVEPLVLFGNRELQVGTCSVLALRVTVLLQRCALCIV